MARGRRPRRPARGTRPTPTAPAVSAVLTESTSTSNTPNLLDQAYTVGERIPNYEVFQGISTRFSGNGSNHYQAAGQLAVKEEKVAADFSLDETEPPGTFREKEDTRLAKRQRPNRIPLLDLKQRAARPDLVEWYDANAPDPLFLVNLKCAPGVVQVPPHWQNKNEYLSRLTGRARKHYELPEYIKDTGIQAMRNVLQSETNLKQKTRERVQPKLGQLDVDFGKLHAAFFKFQKKPPLTPFGTLHQDGGGRDEVLQQDDYRPGVLSDRLRRALDMTGEVPPWTSTMVKLGFPPWYPHLKPGNGKLQKSAKASLTKYWGVVAEADLSESESEELEESDVDDPKIVAAVDDVSSPESVVEYAQGSSESDHDEEAQKPRTESASHIQDHDILGEQQQNNASNVPLYRELTEVTEQGGFLGPSKRYNI